MASYSVFSGPDILASIAPLNPLNSFLVARHTNNLSGVAALLSFLATSTNMPYLLSSCAIQAHWGHLVHTGIVKCDYKDISINNVIMLGIRIRIIILKVTALSV